MSDRMKLLEDDLLERKRISEATRKKRKVNWYLLSPLLFAPALPLIRISLRRYPKIRDRAFKFTLASAFIHGTALLLGVYNNDPNATED